MFLIPHLFLDHLVFLFLNRIFPSIVSNNLIMISTALITSVLPDLSGIFYSKIKDHHDDFLHTPILWVFICLIVYLLNILSKNNLLITLSIILFFETQFHILFDFITARTIGIRLLFPFNKKVYSLFSINPSKGDVDLRFLRFTKKQNEYFKFYFQNKFLILIELLILILGITIF